MNREREVGLTVEMLARALQAQGVRGLGGFNGSCDVFPRLDELVKALLNEAAKAKAGAA